MKPEHLAIISMMGTAINGIVAFIAIRKHCNDDRDREIHDRVRSELNTERIVDIERRLRGE